MSKAAGYPVYVEWWPDDWPHGHQLLIADGSMPENEMWAIIAADMEGYAAEFAEVILVCNPTKHGGRGRTHTHKDAQKAFTAAMQQLLTRDYRAEWADQLRKEAMFKKWGGHMPAAVISYHPENPKQETLMVPDKQGNPVWYNIGKKRHVLKDILDRPREGKNAVKHPTGLGWMRKPKNT